MDILYFMMWLIVTDSGNLFAVVSMSALALAYWHYQW